VVLKQVGLELDGLAFDPMIASFLLDPLRRSHGIDALAEDLLGHKMIPITELIGRGKNQLTMDQVSVDQVCEYAAEDADYTWRLAEVLRPQIEGSPLRSLFEETEMPLVEVLAEMEHNGVALDTGLLAEMSRELTDRIGELADQIHAAAGRPFNIDSTKQLAEVLFDEQQLPVVRKTKTGRSTDAETLETLARQTDHPIPRLMLEYRELAKLRSTYLDTLPGMVCAKTGRLHAGFHQTGAVTGRLSSSDPNLQNIPVRTELGRRIRQAFVAGDSGSVLLVADYSQIELRVLAHFCRDEALLEAFRNELDIHAFVAAQVNGIEVPEVTPAQRSAAKAVNFGIIYGQTPFGLARALGIAQAEAREFIERYHARYPGIKTFIDACIATTREKGYAETILGRRRPIPELHSRNRQQVALGERLAVNTVVQGSAADLIKRAMIDIHREIKSKKLATKLLIQVHDELVFEVRKADVESHSEMIRQKMTSAIRLDVPVVVDIGAGPSWLEAK
jgi:DNA polymerase-1